MESPEKQKKAGQIPSQCLHFAFTPPLRRLLTARANGLAAPEERPRSKESLADRSPPPGNRSPTTAWHSKSESILVSEVLLLLAATTGPVAGRKRWLPIGVSETTAEKYFSCSRLVDISLPDVVPKTEADIITKGLCKVKKIQKIREVGGWPHTSTDVLQ